MADAKGGLIGLIADEVWLRLCRLCLSCKRHGRESVHFLQDTVTGFLLAGVGNVDMRKKCNYLIVDSSTLSLSGLMVCM